MHSTTTDGQIVRRLATWTSPATAPQRRRSTGLFITSPAEDRDRRSLPGGWSRVLPRAYGGTDRAVRSPVLATEARYALNPFVDGADAPFDAALRSAGSPASSRESSAEASINVEPRVARLARRGRHRRRAAPHRSQLSSSGAEARPTTRRCWTAASRGGARARRAQQAGKDIPSSGDLRAVLSKAAAQSRTGGVAGFRRSRRRSAPSPSSTDRTGGARGVLVRPTIVTSCSPSCVAAETIPSSGGQGESDDPRSRRGISAATTPRCATPGSRLSSRSPRRASTWRACSMTRSPSPRSPRTSRSRSSTRHESRARRGDRANVLDRSRRRGCDRTYPSATRRVSATRRRRSRRRATCAARSESLDPQH